MTAHQSQVQKLALGRPPEPGHPQAALWVVGETSRRDHVTAARSRPLPAGRKPVQRLGSGKDHGSIRDDRSQPAAWSTRVISLVSMSSTRVAFGDRVFHRRREWDRLAAGRGTPTRGIRDVVAVRLQGLAALV